MVDLRGQVALVTGAGGMRGVGRSIALKLASAGADLALTDAPPSGIDAPPHEIAANWRGLENVSDEVCALGARCQTIECDLTDEVAIERMFSSVLARFEHVDILVNNARATIGRDRARVIDLDDGVWERFFAINVTAPFRLIKLAARQMIANGKGGRIINIGSKNSSQAEGWTAAYSASKFALTGLTQASALDLAQNGILVNQVCPGSVNTDRLSYWEQDAAREEGVTLAEFRSKVVRKTSLETPLGRIAEPDDVADLVLFLVSDQARFITGQSYHINGGAYVT